jgi:flagellar biosynthesis protein FlhF
VNLKTYRAATIADALAQVKKDLGANAVILHTRTYRKGAILGIGGRAVVEITASSAVNVVHPLARKGKAPAPAEAPAQGSSLLRKAYGIAQAPSPVEAPRTGAEGPAGLAPRPAVAPEIEASAALSAARDVAREVVAASATTSKPGGGDDPLWDELSSIKRLVGQVLHSSRRPSQPAMPEALFQRYLRLIEAEVAAEVADEIVGGVRDELSPEELADDAIVHQAVLRRLEKHIPVASGAPRAERDGDGRPLTLALVGPTGVGKTTTVAKLAATYKLRHGKNVGLVTCDTYRIAAVDQLRTYADIIGLPLKVALTPAEMADACESLKTCDVILIDTAGRSQHDGARLKDLGAFLAAARPHETHLVLSSAASECVLRRAAERFAVASPNRVIFTKLDEAVNFGLILNVARSVGAKLSFVTTGQEVPDHIEPGRADRLARLVLEGGAAR